MFNGVIFIARLASVQDQKVPIAPSLAFNGEPPGTAERRQVLCRIQNMIPDHNARLQSLEVRELN